MKIIDDLEDKSNQLSEHQNDKQKLLKELDQNKSVLSDKS